MAAPNDALLTLAGDLRTMFALPHWARRVARLVTVGLLAALAVLSGLMVGRMGQGSRHVRAIAPTGQPVRRQALEPQVAPWPLSEQGPGGR